MNTTCARRVRRAALFAVSAVAVAATAAHHCSFWAAE